MASPLQFLAADVALRQFGRRNRFQRHPAVPSAVAPWDLRLLESEKEYVFTYPLSRGYGLSSENATILFMGELVGRVWPVLSPHPPCRGY